MQQVKRFTLLMLLLTLIASPALDAYLDPHIGRFIQRDPAGDGGNWYVYTANNPMKFIDPSGLKLKFSDSGVTLTNVSQVANFDIGRLSTQDQVLFYGLFGTKADGDAGDAVNFLHLDATGDMLTKLINHSGEHPFTLGWGNLGANMVRGEYDDGFQRILINNNNQWC